MPKYASTDIVYVRTLSRTNQIYRISSKSGPHCIILKLTSFARLDVKKRNISMQSAPSAGNVVNRYTAVSGYQRDGAPFGIYLLACVFVILRQFMHSFGSCAYTTHSYSRGFRVRVPVHRAADIRAKGVMQQRAAKHNAGQRIPTKTESCTQVSLLS